MKCFVVGINRYTSYFLKGVNNDRKKWMEDVKERLEQENLF